MIKCLRFHKFLRPEFALNQRRLLSAEAVLKVNVVTRKPRKRVPKAVRKAMVDDYVNRYRALNAGKFPSVENTMSEVGGSWYTIRSILQELKHNSTLSVVETADNSSMVGHTYLRNDISAVKGIVDSASSFDNISESEGYGDLPENRVHCQEMLDYGSSDKIVLMPIRTTTKETSVEDDLVSQTLVDFGLKSQGDGTCAGAEDTTSMQSREVLKKQIFTEEISPEILDTKSSMDNSELYEKSSLSAGGPGLSSTVFVEVDETSAQAPKFTRGTTTQKTQEPEQETLWGNLKSMASRFINDWLKT